MEKLVVKMGEGVFTQKNPKDHFYYYRNFKINVKN